VWPWAGGQPDGPPLLWSETPSVLREMAFRGDISDTLAELAPRRFLGGKLESPSNAVTISPQRPGKLPMNSDGRRPMTQSTSHWRNYSNAVSSCSTAACAAGLTGWGLL
jgi:hypothetical protein